jgi:hypothetical protein
MHRGEVCVYSKASLHAERQSTCRERVMSRGEYACEGSRMSRQSGSRQSVWASLACRGESVCEGETIMGRSSAAGPSPA